MPTFRTWNTSKILWDKDTIGRTLNYWSKWVTPPVNPPGSGRMTNAFGGRYLDFEEQMKKLNSPAIVIEGLNANYSPMKQNLMEKAGIMRQGIGFTKESTDVDISISNIQIK